MENKSTDRLQWLLQNVAPKFNTQKADFWDFRYNPEKWSKKEILGHLVDSATNNHHRFVRSQAEETPTIFYLQDDWVKLTHYGDLDIQIILNLWKTYNQFILELVKTIPDSQMQKTCDWGGGEVHSLEYIFEDYVKHLEHHLHQIVEYDN